MFLRVGDVNHIVNLGASEKLRLVGHNTYTMEYFVGPIKLACQLLVPARNQGIFKIELYLQIHLVLHLKFSLTAVLICLLFHVILSSLQMLP